MTTNRRKTRKEYVIYPANYTPGDGYKKATSVLQAKKAAIRYYGAGSVIHVMIRTKARQDEEFFGGSSTFAFLMELSTESS